MQHHLSLGNPPNALQAPALAPAIHPPHLPKQCFNHTQRKTQTPHPPLPVLQTLAPAVSPTGASLSLLPAPRSDTLALSHPPLCSNSPDPGAFAPAISSLPPECPSTAGTFSSFRSQLKWQLLGEPFSDPKPISVTTPLFLFFTAQSPISLTIFPNSMGAGTLYAHPQFLTLSSWQRAGSQSIFAK